MNMNYVVIIVLFVERKTVGQKIVNILFSRDNAKNVRRSINKNGKLDQVKRNLLFTLVEGQICASNLVKLQVNGIPF